MTYLLKHRSGKSGFFGKIGRLSLVFLILVLIFYFGSGLFAPSFVKILAPILSLTKKTSQNFALALRLFEPELSIISENQALKERVDNLNMRVFDYQMMVKENQMLREKLGFVENGFTVVNVLLMPPKTPYDTIIIDKGSSHGIFAGAKAMTSERIVLGFVEEIHENIARVRMYSSPDIKTDAILESDGTFVELLGTGGGNFFLEAPIDFDIVEGDIFLIPGAERLAVASVGQVKRDEASSFLSVFLRRPLELNGNSTLLVEIK